MYLNWLEHFVSSFIKIQNRRPCRTPNWIVLGFEFTLFIHMYSVLSLLDMSETTPKLFLIYHKYLNLMTESRSQHNQIPCENPRIKKIQYYQNTYAYTCRYCKKCKISWVVDFLARKPYWCSCRIGLFSKYCCLYSTFWNILLESG